jgi:hypothetical protein
MSYFFKPKIPHIKGLIIIIILLTATGLSPGGSTQSHTTIQSTTQIKIHRTQLEKKKMWKSAGHAPSKNASFTLAFAYN